ncbi:uncharacterized protein [Dendrobates tinctorius]|uniref:uncharacterized protein n=1 Tax=Dendrobates tinctorius TaxID=92724 RepID=UPI003CC99A39
MRRRRSCRKMMQPQRCPASAPLSLQSGPSSPPVPESKRPAAASPSPQSGPSSPPVLESKRPAAAAAKSEPSSLRTPQSKRPAAAHRGTSTPRTPQGRPVTLHRQDTQQRNFYRHGKQLLMEMGEYQKSAGLILQTQQFAKLVREVCMENSCGTTHPWEQTAIMALQEAAEAFLERLIRITFSSRLRTRRVTLCAGDIQLAQRICGFQNVTE